jgi:Putative DNA-binding domain
LLKLDNLEELQTLHGNRVQESATLEYKASAAVDNTDAKKLEISKDISAMANAEGGQFVYGMSEANHMPNGLDEGFSPNPFNGLWFEQVIQQNIRPSVEGLKIFQIPLENGNVVAVITVPQSKTIHQAKDGRYYRRRNFRNDIMQDYEIREALNRSKTPDLFLEFRLDKGLSTQPVSFAPSKEISNAIPLVVAIGNRSHEPALYALVKVMIDAEMQVGKASGFGRAGTLNDDNGHPMTIYSFNLAIPHSMPVFHGPLFTVGQPFELSLSSAWLHRRETFPLWYELTCPGFSKLVKGQFVLERYVLTIDMPS